MLQNAHLIQEGCTYGGLSDRVNAIDAWRRSEIFSFRVELESGSALFEIDTSELSGTEVISRCASTLFAVAPSSNGPSPNGGVWLKGRTQLLRWWNKYWRSCSCGNTVHRTSLSLVEQGVERSTLLFNGTVSNSGKYQGTARIFSKRCGDPMEYPVSGSATIGEYGLVFESQRPVRRNCQLTGETVVEELQFSIAR